MVLGREVVNRDGRRLFDAGIILSEKMIRALKMWGILEVTIPKDGIPEELTPQNPPPGRTRLDTGEKKAVLARHFRHNDLENSVVKDIYALSFERIETCPEVLNFLLEPSKKGSEKSDVHDQYPVNGIHSLLADEIKLPSLPTIFSEINAAIKNPSFSGKDIADIVSKDTSLSATILKIVNSAYYGFNEPVESLAYAAMALGSRQVCSLALGITVINYFKGLPGNRINMQSFWRHSVACGITAQILASHVEKVNKERVFIGGLLHDIGQLVFLCYYPRTAGIAFGQAGKLDLSPHQVEPRYFGVTHAVFGGLIADKWNFSTHISAQIRHHHDDFKEKPPREIAIVYFSNWLVNALGIGSSARYNLPRLNMNAWQSLGISHRVLEPVIRQLDRQLVEAIKFFYE
ncbi:MAG: HDOD domain-containing protein [Proteobacteria bacterium]|nr:HDOD domain-containing protein [Desulfobacula sp.]MBU3953480.1 HDOD domain-containing protein [Pseudomonadota bacterium]MBU4132433.1 HDOD domain-containing protein [Pseudomonadota bacterium]